MPNFAEQEIQSHTGNVSPAEQAQWLVDHDMLATPETPYRLATDTEWIRPGAESYVMQFSVWAENNRARFIAKACIKFAPVDCVQEWLGRRALLEAHGVATPQLHAVNRACIIEEYIAYDLPTAYRQGSALERTQLQDRYIETYQRVCAAGFRPIGLSDARSRGSDIILIDFGSDLGSPLAAQSVPLSDNEVQKQAQQSMQQIWHNTIKGEL